MKNDPNLAQCTQTPQNILTWLQTFNKANKPSPRQPLQQQLQSLSLSYKNAQEKLLSLQKQTYYQSLHNEKQRSIIEILKYIINGSLDDDTILTYLVQMQEQSVGDLESKYQIKTELQQIKQMVLRRKKEDKKAEGLKSVAINDLKKEINKCNLMKRQLIQDLDRTLNEKGILQSQIQQMKTQNKSQTEQILALQQQLNQMKQICDKVSVENRQLQEQLSKKSQTLIQKQELILKIKQQLAKSFKNYDSESENPKDIMKLIKKMQQKQQKYKNVIREMSQKMKKNSDNNQLMSSFKYFLPEQAIKVYDQFQKTGQKCLLKQMQNIARLQRKKYSQLQSCQEEVWRLKQRLLRQGSWLKSRKTGATSGNKQNYQPNLMVRQQKISQFNFQTN